MPFLTPLSGAKMAKRSEKALVGLTLRLREPLRRKLEAAAKKRGVSLNAELVARLERSFQTESLEQVAKDNLETARAMEEWAEKRFGEADKRFDETVRLIRDWQVDYKTMSSVWKEFFEQVGRDPTKKFQIPAKKSDERQDDS